MFYKPGVSYYVSLVDIANGREVIQDVFDHRLACNLKQRLGLIQRKGVETRCVACSKNYQFHFFFIAFNHCAIETLDMFNSDKIDRAATKPTSSHSSSVYSGYAPCKFHH